jgi:8-oxo-dGTP pyrophosphatase MutT (NUDIX family)
MLRPDDPARDLERRFYDDIGSHHRIRVAARALIILENSILLQRLDYTGANWFFPGGEVMFGETLEDAIRRELAEETSMAVRRVVYRLTANNRYEREGRAVHMLEHFFEVTPESFEVESLEEHLLLEWHPLYRIRELDVRPRGVRDMLGIDGWETIRLLEVE